MPKVSREKDELRNLAAQAKMRMKMGYWSKIKQERERAKQEANKSGISEDAVNNYYRSKITREIKSSDHTQDDTLYKKVCQILDDNEDIINPIGLLIDQNTYGKMDSRARQRYVLMLSAKYQELSERYYAEKVTKVLD